MNVDKIIFVLGVLIVIVGFIAVGVAIAERVSNIFEIELPWGNEKVGQIVTTILYMLVSLQLLAFYVWILLRYR